MKIIAITGGIATGKSSAVQKLISALGDSNCRLFDSDAAAHNLLTTPDIIAKVAQEFGNEVLNPDGSVNRSALREIVFEDDNHRLELEAILHPEILNSARASLAQANTDDAESPAFFLLEVPLLYEVDFPIERDLDIAIAATPETQIERLTKIRNLNPEMIDRLLSAQLPVETKITRADIVIWNDGSIEEFNHQIDLISRSLIDF